MKTRTLFCETSCKNPNVDRCNYAAITLNEHLISRIKQRTALVREIGTERDTMIEEVAFLHLEVDYFDYDYEHPEECRLFISALTGEGDWVEAPCDVPSEWKQRTECDQMIVSADGRVWWRAYPKHGDYMVETRPLEVTQLDAMLAQEVTANG